MSIVRKRARELGIVPGIPPVGVCNAITDVTGVRAGHVTLIEGDNIRNVSPAVGETNDRFLNNICRMAETMIENNRITVEGLPLDMLKDLTAEHHS